MAMKRRPIKVTIDVRDALAEVDRLRSENAAMRRAIMAEHCASENAAMRRAIMAEHFASNGTSVYMDGPPQHERSGMRCTHLLCLALEVTPA